MTDMAENTTTISLPDWYRQGKFIGSALVGFTECSVSENDPDAPVDAVNRMRLSLHDAEGKPFTLDFYNYRICEKNFEYTPLVKFKWVADEMRIYSRNVLYAEIEFDIDSGIRKLLSLSFETTLLNV